VPGQSRQLTTIFILSNSAGRGYIPDLNSPLANSICSKPRTLLGAGVFLYARKRSWMTLVSRNRHADD
jgi:hypothetical protein